MCHWQWFALAAALVPGVFALQGPNGSGSRHYWRCLRAPSSRTPGKYGSTGAAWPTIRSWRGNAWFKRPTKVPSILFLTGRDLFDFVASARKCRPDESVQTMVDELGLTPHLATRFSAMSFGTQKKCLLCAAWKGVVLRRPKISAIEQHAPHPAAVLRQPLLV